MQGESNGCGKKEKQGRDARREWTGGEEGQRTMRWWKGKIRKEVGNEKGESE